MLINCISRVLREFSIASGSNYWNLFYYLAADSVGPTNHLFDSNQVALNLLQISMMITDQNPTSCGSRSATPSRTKLEPSRVVDSESANVDEINDSAMMLLLITRCSNTLNLTFFIGSDSFISRSLNIV